MTTFAKQVFLLGHGPRADHGVDILGGRPPGVTAARWPRTRSGEPMQHVVTVDVRGRLPELAETCAAIAVFVPDVAMAPIDAKHEEQAVVKLTEADLAIVPDDEPPCALLPCRRLEVSAFCTIDVSEEKIAIAFAPGIDAEPVERDREEDDAEDDVAELLGEVLDDEGANVSYLGGVGAISSSPGARSAPDRSAFVLRLAETMLEPEGNFAGGGFLFVFEGGLLGGAVRGVRLTRRAAVRTTS